MMSQANESAKNPDAWMDSWWYATWVRALIGGLCLFGLLGLSILNGLESGDFGMLYFVAIGLVVFLPLERWMPRHKMKVLRPHLLTDFFHVIVTSFLAFLPLIFIFPFLEPLRVDNLGTAIHSQPKWLQIAEALFFTEFLIYWGHRMTHEVPFLWKFHSIHHSVNYLDWIAGERRHPLDGLFISLFTGIPLLITGFDLVDLLIVGLFNESWDMTIHANLRWRLKFMDRIWVTTEYHHWHHSTQKEVRDKNYAGALPIMDILFGTYYLPKDKHPGPYGIDSHMPTTYFGQLIQPFR